MKKLLALLLCLAMVFTFAACGGSDGNNGGGDAQAVSFDDIDDNCESEDGTYQIDVYAEFTALNSKFKVLCECKQYTSSVSREKVAVLHDKIESIGAHKGILLATSDFQSGAIQYAQAHGIALIKVEDHTLENYSFSNGSGILDEKKDMVLEAIKREGLKIIDTISQDQWISYIVQKV